MLRGTAGGGGRRFLLTGVVSRYQLEPSWNREELAGDLQRMVDLFTGELGYEHVPVMGLDPTALQIQDALRDFCTSADRQPDDYIVVYLAGHGEILPVGDTGFEHVLLPADASPGDLRRRAVKSADLAEWMLADTPVRRLLLIVDACYSGMGGLDFARNALARIGTPTQLTQGDGSGVVVVTATQPAQQAIAGAFTTAFARAVRSQATAGHAPGSLSIDAVLNVLKADPELPASQQAQWSLLAGSGTIPDFLPNPRRDAALVDLDLDEQDRRWRARRALERQRAEELRGQFVPRIPGFTGRHRALADITRWLDTPADARPVIVTGDPGSGKTAVLGLLAALADPPRRPTVPRDGLPAGAIPDAGRDRGGHLRGNLTTGQVLAGLAAAAGIEDINPDPAALGSGLTRLLAGLRGSGRPLVAMIDALDEAADPGHLAGELLRPLIERGRGSIRLLLGTRRHVCDHLGRGWRDRCEVIDLDGPGYADPAALAEVIRRTLRRHHPRAGHPAAARRSPRARRRCWRTVTAAIAEAAGHSFFVARILAATQAAQPALPDPADPAWRASLPRAAGPAMRRDLDLRLGDKAAQAVDLLLPLAYAQGGGLPWEDIWPLLANALAPGHGYTNEDLLWLAGHAGSFIVEGGTIAGRSIYRLYHRSLAEDLLAGRDQAADQHAITTALTSHVPRRHNGRRDWPASHPYTRAHLATHAARGGGIDDLAQDPGFLLAADPPRTARRSRHHHQQASPRRRRRLPQRPAADPPPPARRARLLPRAGRTMRTSRSPRRPHRRRRPAPARGAPAGHPGSCNAPTSRSPATTAGCGRWRRRSWTAARWSSPAATTGRCGCGTWPPAPRSATRSPATAARCSRWRRRSWTAARWSSPAATTGRCGCGTWPPAPRSATRSPATPGTVHAVAAAELDGRPVVISGSDDRTVRVWDLATGTPVGDPFTGHAGPVNAVAAAELDGRPVVISGSDDGTVRVWDLATGTPVGDPFTGHTGPVHAVAAAELDGRPVVISGSGDRTVRVWDLATGTPVGDPFTGHGGPVHAVAAAELDGRPVVISGSERPDGAGVGPGHRRPGRRPVHRPHRRGERGGGRGAGRPPGGHLRQRRPDGAGVGPGHRRPGRRPVHRPRRPGERGGGRRAGRPPGGHLRQRRRDGAGVGPGHRHPGRRPVHRPRRPGERGGGRGAGRPPGGHLRQRRPDGAGVGPGHRHPGRRPVHRPRRPGARGGGRGAGRPPGGHLRQRRPDGAGVGPGHRRPGRRPVHRPHRPGARGGGGRAGRPPGGHLRQRRPDGAGVGPGHRHPGRRPVHRPHRPGERGGGRRAGRPPGGHLRQQRPDGAGVGPGHRHPGRRPVHRPRRGPVHAVAAAELDGRPVVISGSDDRTVRVWDLATGTPVGDPFTGHTAG